MLNSTDLKLIDKKFGNTTDLIINGDIGGTGIYPASHFSQSSFFRRHEWFNLYSIGDIPITLVNSLV